jgi:hypothetical protein
VTKPKTNNPRVFGGELTRDTDLDNPWFGGRVRGGWFARVFRPHNGGGWFASCDFGDHVIQTGVGCASPHAALRNLRGTVLNQFRAMENLLGKGKP